MLDSTALTSVMFFFKRHTSAFIKNTFNCSFVFQPVGIFDSDKSQRVTLEMKKLRHTLNDVIQSMSALDMSSLHKDG